MLWVDKHRPRTLQTLTHHPKITRQLHRFASEPATLPHLLFYGPPGAGKKTRVSALLRAIYGTGAERLRLDKRTFVTPTGKSVDINLVCSNYHIELSPGDAGIYDRYVVQDVIKEMAATKSLTSSTSNPPTAHTGDGKKNSNSNANVVQYKVVVLVAVDQLTKQAQAALRRTMEKYAAGCRLILLCNNPSKVIDPVRSRCLGIRIPAPTHDDISSILQSIARKEQVTVPDSLAVQIARECSRNLRRAILMLESARVQSSNPSSLSPTAPLPKTDWELYIIQLAADITREQSPQRLLAAREKLYELLINCIPPSVIISYLALELVKNVDDTLKPQVMEAAAFYEHRIALGSKDIFHLEAFVAKYMTIYKKYLNDLFAS